MTLTEIQEYLREQSTPERAEKMKKIAPGATRIYGVINPVINDLAKHLQVQGFDLVETLWNAGAYEERLLAVKLIYYLAKKDPARAIRLVKQFAPQIDNWTICDTLGMQSLKRIKKSHIKEIFELAGQYADSKHMWERRLSLVLVEEYCKQPPLHSAIKKLVDCQRADKEYYMKRAVIWLDSALSKHE